MDSVAAALPGAVAASGKHRGPRDRLSVPSRSRVLRVLLIAVLVGVAAILAMIANGRFPGLSSGLTSTLDSEGQIGCLSQHNLLATSCPDTGVPVGKEIVLGFAPYWIAALIAKVLGIGSHSAFLTIFGLTCVLSIVGTMLLLRRLSVRWPLGLIAGALFLIAPSILGLNGFGGTQFGFMLLPLAVAADLWLIDDWRRSSWGRRGIMVLLGAAAKVGLLFTDGYSFVACAVVSGCLLVGWFVRRPGWWTAVQATVAFVLVNAVGYLAYSAVFPGSSEFERSPTTLFRAMGLDATTLWIPGPFLWWAQWQQLGTNLGNLAGDTSNSLWNYPGMLCVALAVVGIVLCRRNGLVWSLLAAGLVTLVLSFGPSLKVGIDRPAVAPGKALNLYSLHADQATLSLPTTVLHEDAPGIDLMRSTYRWYVGTRLVLIVLAGVGTQQLFVLATRSARRDRRVLIRAGVGLVGLAAIVELMPGTELGSMYRTTEASRLQITSMAAELNRVIPAGSRVVFASQVSLPNPNDYLVDYLAQDGRYTTYNVSEDKDVTVVKKKWSQNVRTIITGGQKQVDDAVAAFAQGEADLVIVPFFDIQISAWPAPQSFVDAGKALATKYAANAALTVRTYDDFAVVTPSQD